jgi:hypothetical protein
MSVTGADAPGDFGGVGHIGGVGVNPDLQLRHSGWRERKGRQMQKIIWLVLVTAAMSGCAPLLIGGAGAVVVDEAIEQDQGGDGLF